MGAESRSQTKLTMRSNMGPQTMIKTTVFHSTSASRSRFDVGLSAIRGSSKIKVPRGLELIRTTISITSLAHWL